MKGQPCRFYGGAVLWFYKWMVALIMQAITIPVMLSGS